MSENRWIEKEWTKWKFSTLEMAICVASIQASREKEHLLNRKSFFFYFDILFQKLYILYMCLFEYFSGIFCHCLMMSNILGDGLKCAKCEIDCDGRVGRWWGRWLLITDRASWNRISWHDSHWTFPRIRWAMMSVC